jgi:hypothetical protein
MYFLHTGLKGNYEFQEKKFDYRFSQQNIRDMPQKLYHWIHIQKKLFSSIISVIYILYFVDQISSQISSALTRGAIHFSAFFTLYIISMTLADIYFVHCQASQSQNMTQKDNTEVNP